MSRLDIAHNVAFTMPRNWKTEVEERIVGGGSVNALLAVRCGKWNVMKQLEKKLKDLQKQGYEQVTIIQMLNWIYDIQRENRLKRVRSTDR